ncbi:MAG: hypothetical protein AAF598_16210 [Bacteroidota bacterium]
MNSIKYISCFLLIASFFSCDLEREIEVPLPPFVKQTMVECYLEDGKPLRVLLSETFPFTDIPTEFPFAEGATVVIKFNGQSDTLQEGIFVNPSGSTKITVKRGYLWVHRGSKFFFLGVIRFLTAL